MAADEYFRAFRRLQHTAKWLLPVLLSLDMCHNMLIVNRMWKARLREWREEDESRTKARMTAVCSHLAVRCHTQHKDLWPAGLAAHLFPADPASLETTAGQGEVMHTIEDDFLPTWGLTSWDLEEPQAQHSSRTVAEAKLPPVPDEPLGQQADGTALKNELTGTLHKLWLEAMGVMHLPAAWSSQSITRSMHQWQLPKKLWEAFNSSIDDSLQAMQLPKMCCTRRSALRFRMDSFEWHLLSRLLSADAQPPLEVCLDEE